jgi:predicted nucleic acid-binding protein
VAPTRARGIVALDETRPPAAIVLDTSAVIEFVLPSQTAHQQWRRFLITCGRQGTLLVFNQLVEIELYDVLFNIALIERWGKGAAHGPKRYDGRVRRRAARLLDLYRRGWERLLDGSDTTVIELGEVADQAPRLIGRYGLRSHDAVHAATAMLTEGLIATADSGFAALPEQDLEIVTDPDRVPHMRRRRAQWARR